MAMGVACVQKMMSCVALLSSACASPHYSSSQPADRTWPHLVVGCGALQALQHVVGRSLAEAGPVLPLLHALVQLELLAHITFTRWCSWNSLPTSLTGSSSLDRPSAVSRTCGHSKKTKHNNGMSRTGECAVDLYAERFRLNVVPPNAGWLVGCLPGAWKEDAGDAI